MSERLCMSYEVLYDTLALVAETGQSQVYIYEATSEVHSEVGGTSWYWVRVGQGTSWQ